MTTRAEIDDFLACERIAVVGLSRSGRKFGRAAYRELKSKGYDLVPVHPQAADIDGDPCSPTLAAISPPADGVLVIVPPAQALAVVHEADRAGINRVWLQQGAQSDEAIRFCHEHGMRVVADECILMFAKPTGFFHRAHRWVAGALGQVPR